MRASACGVNPGGEADRGTAYGDGRADAIDLGAVMIAAVAIALHALAASIWVGGMFFAHMALKPAGWRRPRPSWRASAD
jgi:putative copper export protein